MAGIRCLVHKDRVMINHIINKLLHPEIRKALFDDRVGMNELSIVLFDPRTVVYGLFEGGSPRPIGVIYFTGVIPGRNCYLYAALFDKKQRQKGRISKVAADVKKDLIIRHSVHSVSSCVIGKNAASFRLMEKLGFKDVGVQEKCVRNDGRYKDLTTFYLLLENQLGD